MFSRVLIIALSGVLLLSSCAKDDETAPIDASTQSPNGKFLGTWYVSEESKLYGTATYNINIGDSPDNDHVLMSYLYGYKTPVRGTTISTAIVIPTQIIEANEISGKGTLMSSNRIHLTYYVNTGFDNDTISAVLTR